METRYRSPAMTHPVNKTRTVHYDMRQVIRIMLLFFAFYIALRLFPAFSLLLVILLGAGIVYTLVSGMITGGGERVSREEERPFQRRGGFTSARDTRKTKRENEGIIIDTTAEHVDDDHDE